MKDGRRSGSRSTGSVDSLVSLSNAGRKPLFDFLLDPSDAPLSESYSFGKLPGIFEPLDVLRGVEDFFAYLLLR